MKKIVLLFLMFFCIGISSVSAASNPYPYLNGYNCTYYAWQRAYDKLGIALPGWNDAWTWKNGAINAGYPVDTTASADSIVVWPSNPNYCWNGYCYTAGHVAYVESVSGSTMHISESNWAGNSYHEADLNVNDTRNYGQPYFIHLKNSEPEVSYKPSGSIQNLGDNFLAQVRLKYQPGIALEVSGKEDGSPVYLGTSGRNNYYQYWNFIRQSDGSYEIVSTYANLSLDVASYGSVNGNEVYVWHHNDDGGYYAKNRWFIYDYNGGYRLVPLSARDKMMALDVPDGYYTLGNQFQIYEALRPDNEAQTFSIEIVPTSISLKKTSTTLEVGETEQINVNFASNVDDRSLYYYSNNKSVATVSEDGVITAKGAGTATITVKTINGITTTMKVTVTESRPITSLTVSPTSVSLSIGETLRLTSSVSPSNTTDSKTLSYKSSNTSVATVSTSGLIVAKNTGTATITVTTSNGISKKVTVTVKKPTSITYQTHVQQKGWLSTVSNGATSGTTGSGLRMETLKISLTNQEYDGDIEYRSHIQRQGWESTWKKNGENSGTTGKSLRLEAVQIRLTGEMAEHYDIYYRVHSQRFGWLDWAKNGEKAGTEGFGYRVEAIQIKLVKKGGSAPGSTTRPHVAFTNTNVLYQTQVQQKGWLGVVSTGNTSGTTGLGLRMEAIKLTVDSDEISGGILYRSHIQRQGWESSWKSNGVMSGTTGQALRLEAIQIQLTGEMAEHYNIYYRVHSQMFGWMGWAKNGEKAGTSGYGYRLEAIQIRLLRKDEGAPGTTLNHYLAK